jgi:riboflavin synthase
VFTGIVQAIGRVAARESVGGDMRLLIDAGTLDLGDVAPGDSIAVAGVCLTAVTLDGARFVADVSAETLALTTLGTLAVGDAVNLEKALRLADRLGGHLVSGHVDGVGEVVGIEDDDGLSLPKLSRQARAGGRAWAGSERWTFRVPRPLARYIAVKGSICVDGASLTVNTAGVDTFGVTLIPHTLAVTTFGERRIGAAVNLEVDLVARHVERLLGDRMTGKQP